MTYYGLERTIYRICTSKYAKQFVLKGSIFLQAIFDRNYERTAVDLDLFERHISNSSEEMSPYRTKSNYNLVDGNNLIMEIFSICNKIAE